MAFKKLALFCCFTSVGFGSVDVVKAQSIYDSECNQAFNVPSNDWPFGASADHISYYVHEDFASKMVECSPVYNSNDPVTTLHATGVIKHAAELWNLYALGTPLVYRGSVSDYNLEAFCNNPARKKPAILIDYRVGCAFGGEGVECREDCDNHGDGNCNGNFSCVSSNCIDGVLAYIRSVEGCDDAMQIVFVGDPNFAHSCGSGGVSYDLNDVSAGVLSQQSFSLLKVAVHELGHVLNLGHPGGAESGMMSSSYQDFSPARHPHKWDKDCILHPDSNNHRSVRYRHQSFRNGSWNDMKSHSYTTRRAPVVDGSWWDHFSKDYIYSLLDATSAAGFFFFDYYFPASASGNLEFGAITSSTNVNDFKMNVDSAPSFFSVGNSPVVLNDDQRIAYNQHGHSLTNVIDPPRLRYMRSQNMFQSSTTGTFSQCGNVSCTSISEIRTSIPLSHTFDQSSKNDIFVTVQETDKHNGGIISVHVGMDLVNRMGYGFEMNVSNTTLPSSNSYWQYTHLTDFKPAIACAPNREQFDFNCLLAWAPRGALNGGVLYTYFHYDNDDEKVYWHGAAYRRGGALTRSHVSAAWFDDTFWLGWKHWTYPARAKRSYNTGTGYGSWSTAEDPGGNQLTMVDPPTFFYPPLTVWPNHESGWAWTETY